MVNRQPHVLILAAGQSLRFGSSKLLAPLAGQPLIAHTVAAVRACGLPWRLVVRPQEQALQTWADDHRCVIAPDADLGLGHSIAAGVAATADAPGWLMLPADMPWIDSTLLQAVAAAMDDHPAAMVAPVWQGQRGHPVGFPPQHRAALLALTGDVGGRALLQTHGFVAVVGGPGCVRDVDVPGDLA